MKTFEIVSTTCQLITFTLKASHYSVENRIGVFMSGTEMIHSVPADEFIVRLIDIK